MMSRLGKLAAKILQNQFSLAKQVVIQLLGHSRSKAAPFGYSGTERAMGTDGFTYRRDDISVSSRFEALATCRQFRAFIFLNHTSKSELALLLEHYGSDKASTGAGSITDKPYPWHAHTYGHFYEMIFKPIRQTARLIFECGLGSSSEDFPANMGPNARPGASLRAWRDYFPNAQILGADIDHESLFVEDRIQTTYVDQTSEDSVRGMWEKFSSLGMVDVIIDDGLHNFKAASTLFLHSFYRLREGGIYIIEDVTPNFLGDYDHFFSSLNLSFQVVAVPRQLDMGDNIFILVVK